MNNNCVFRFYPWLFLLLAANVNGQSAQQLDISLRIDYSSAEEMLDFFDRQTFNANRIAHLPGNQLAASTSLMLARTYGSPDDFTGELERVRDNSKTGKDVYGLWETQSHVQQLRKLLTETKKRQLDRRVIGTIKSFFPSDIRVSAIIPVYVVAMGNEKAAAFVRRVVWKNDAPVFVGENEGEQIIVLNLARMLSSGREVETQFIQLLSTLAHECFHAVFGLYKEQSGVWREYRQRHEPIWSLCDLVQNEGIAYYLSLQIQIGGQSPSQQWFDATQKAIQNLNSSLSELCSASLTPQRARELIMNANLSGSFEGNYGATAGLRIAYEIDTKMGRPALVATIEGGIKKFFGTYDSLCRRNANIPKIDEAVVEVLIQ